MKTRLWILTIRSIFWSSCTLTEPSAAAASSQVTRARQGAACTSFSFEAVLFFFPFFLPPPVWRASSSICFSRLPLSCARAVKRPLPLMFASIRWIFDRRQRQRRRLKVAVPDTNTLVSKCWGTRTSEKFILIVLKKKPGYQSEQVSQFISSCFIPSAALTDIYSCFCTISFNSLAFLLL